MLQLYYDSFPCYKYNTIPFLVWNLIDYIQLPMMKIPNFLRKKLVFFNQLKPENKNQNIAVIIKKLSKSDTA